jgi:hypothetical protein
MMTWITGPLRRWAQQLRFPRLVLLTAILFAADLVIPDVIPFVDEILLALATVILGRMRRPPAVASDSRQAPR